MKVIALLTFRDEAPFLPLYLQGMQSVVDEIVALDDGSTDAGPAILRAAGARVLAARKPGESATTYAARRANLLEEGRRLGGTHFLCLDADERLDSRFAVAGIDRLSELRPGDVLAIPQINLWRSASRYRVGGIYRPPLQCMFRDDGQATYLPRALHESRIPDNLQGRVHVLCHSDATILHFQFLAWTRARAKQAWYQCNELLQGAAAHQVNIWYYYATDYPWVRRRSVPEEWGVPHEEAERLAVLGPSWHLQELLQVFREHGAKRFERLRIWDVAQLRQAFEQETGRRPRPQSAAMVLALRLAADGAARGKSRLRNVPKKFKFKLSV
jgi:hypothetical protein